MGRFNEMFFKLMNLEDIANLVENLNGRLHAAEHLQGTGEVLFYLSTDGYDANIYFDDVSLFNGDSSWDEEDELLLTTKELVLIVMKSNLYQMLHDIEDAINVVEDALDEETKNQ